MSRHNALIALALIPRPAKAIKARPRAAQEQAWPIPATLSNRFINFPVRRRFTFLGRRRFLSNNSNTTLKANEA
jgi:hypothetical protein